MGFIAGFAGGATLLAGITYLALATHARNRHAQSDHLRAQTAQVNLLARDDLAPRRRDPAVDDVLFPLPRAEEAAHRRADVVEAAKDRWNREIEGAVRWAQSKDWGGLEREAGQELVHTGERVVGMMPQAGRAVGDEVRVIGEGVRHLGEEVKGAVGRGVEKGREMVGRARARAQLAEERLESRVDAKILGVSEVEKALAERFEERKEDTRTVKEVLAQRYRPVGERDHSRLRGI